MSTTLTGMDAMMNLRCAYLRAISKHWKDPSYINQLMKNPKGELSKLGFIDSWSVDIVIEKKPSAKWKPVTAAGWIGPDAVVTLWMPPNPGKEDSAEAWAEYYTEFPTYLGMRTKPMVKEALQLGMGKWDDFLEFGGVVMRLIAMYWEDDDLKKKLDKEAEGKHRVIRDGTTILHEWLGYTVPWNARIELKLGNADEVDEYAWDSTKKQWKHCWEKRAKSCTNTLTFHMPDAPPKNEAIDAVALSAYNVTGDQYPFTCP
jgi:ribosomally synthesized peptide (two-chain TOMM family)